MNIFESYSKPVSYILDELGLNKPIKSQTATSRKLMTLTPTPTPTRQDMEQRRWVRRASSLGSREMEKEEGAVM